MAYTVVPTVATGDLWTAANHNTYIRDNFAASVPDVFITAGDLVYGSAADVAARLGIGSAGQVLTVSGGLPAWLTSASTLNTVCSGRLTLTSGVPVTASDVIGGTNVYFTPYTGNFIGLYNGASWATYTFTELTLALGTVISDLPYDVFIYLSGGSPAIEKLAWTNGTTRATALTTQNGVLVKSGDATRRYVGTFYTTSTTTTEDSANKRYLWNYYNRSQKQLVAVDTTDSWTYSTASWRAANNNTTDGVGRFSVVIGYQEDRITVFRTCMVYNGTANARVAIGIGVDSVTVNSAQILGGGYASSFPTPTAAAIYCNALSAGHHYIQSLEYAESGGTTTWYGDYVGYMQFGMLGQIQC
jgi:hypothetical protein